MHGLSVRSFGGKLQSLPLPSAALNLLKIQSFTVIGFSPVEHELSQIRKEKKIHLQTSNFCFKVTTAFIGMYSEKYNI